MTNYSKTVIMYSMILYSVIIPIKYKEMVEIWKTFMLQNVS